MGKVVNEYGVEIDFDVALSMMYQELVDEIIWDLSDYSDQKLFDEYVKRHAEQYGEEDWELAKENPVY